MAYDKVVDSAKLDAGMTATASAIRAKTGGTGAIPWKENTGFADAVAGITSGGAAVSVPMKDVNFYDYDGTRLYSYTVSEAAALTELPPLPTQPGLICQGWNWTLDNIKAMGRAVDVGAMYITDDGKTRIYITLQEGRTSPVLGCCPNGTVTVDWGDGTTPTTLNGESVSTLKWTSMHRYATAGDYVITLTVDGTMGFGAHEDETSAFETVSSAILVHSDGAFSSAEQNYVYLNCVRRIEVGDGVTSIGDYAFNGCSGLVSIALPDSLTSIGDCAFNGCCSLASITLPDGVTSIGDYAFSACSGLASITLPDSLTSIGESAFEYCYSLASITLPDSLTSIGESAFNYCCSLASITLPDSLTSIGDCAFLFCYGVSYYDFSRHATVPELSGADAFYGIPGDCKIRVPAALEGIWKAATNWAEYADYIVGV